jgi:TRAP-type uncharacterized transport system substrate-binding protein
MRRRKISEISTHELLTIVGLSLLMALIIFGITYHFVRSAPPGTVVMATGVEGRTYAALGERYREILARSHVHLKLLPSSGAVENLRRLKDKSLAVDVGFAQGGTSSSSEAPNLLSLGSILYNPLWVFYRSDKTLDDFSQLKGKRIAIGLEGSGARKFSLDLLKASRAADPPTVLFNLADEAANKAVKEGRVDVVITLGTADNTYVQDLLHAQNVKLMSLSQAEAYARLFPALSHVILPKGVVNLAKRVPASDIHLLSPTTNLVVRDTMHPALMYLLLDAAAEIHGGPGWVHKAGEFPAPKVQDFPLSEQAERFYKSGRPFLLDYLPFWVAVFLDRIIKILIPVVVVLIPLIRIMPWLYSWRNRSKLYRWYGELKYLELEVSEHPETKRIADYYAKLDHIEASVKKINVPLAFYREIYTLREHIELVRERVIRLDQRAASNPLLLSIGEHSGEKG